LAGAPVLAGGACSGWRRLFWLAAPALAAGGAGYFFFSSLAPGRSSTDRRDSSMYV
jgi:hypothetical protein